MQVGVSFRNYFEPFFNASVVPKKGEEHHHLLANEVVLDERSPKLKRLREIEPPLLSVGLTRFNLTLLHVCAMTKNHLAAQVLIKKGASLKLQDLHGCTPLHLAAMNRDEILLQQFIAIANKTDQSIRGIRNRLFATAEEIAQSLSLPKYTSDKVVCNFKQGDLPPQPLNSELFKNLTGATYCPHALVSAEAHIKTWLREPEPITFPMTLFHAKYLDFCKKTPLLYLEEEFSSDSTHLSLGLGLRAGENIEKNKILSLYGGQYKERPNSIYSMNQIEADTYCTEAARCNDGFPNCGPVPVLINGIEEPALISFHALQANARLHYNYGFQHTCKWGRYMVSDWESIQSFVSTVDYQNAISRFLIINDLINRSMFMEEEKYLESLYILSKIEYIFDTPAVLFPLIINRKVSFQDVEFIFNYYRSYRKISLQNTHFKQLQIRFDKLKLLIGYINEIPDQAYLGRIKAFLAHLFKNFSSLAVMQEISIIYDNKEDLLGDPETWLTYESQLASELEVKESILSLASHLSDPQKAADAKVKIRKLFKEHAEIFSEITVRFHLIQACSYSRGPQCTQALDDIVIQLFGSSG